MVVVVPAARPATTPPPSKTSPRPAKTLAAEFAEALRVRRPQQCPCSVELMGRVSETREAREFAPRFVVSNTAL